VGVTAHQLLELPNGAHFLELVLSWTHKGDILWITELVERCSHTLDSFDVTAASSCTFVHICVRTNDLTCSQSEWSRTHSTSRKRQNSEIWFFNPDGRPSNGSPSHSEPSHPNIEIFDKSLFICLPTLPSLVPATASGDRLERRHQGGGRTSTTSLSNSGSCVQFARR